MKVTINQNPVNRNTSMESEMDMTKREKLKKVVALAVAYYLEQEQNCGASADNCNQNKRWVSTRQAMHMRGRMMIQQRGRMASTRTLFKKSDTALAS
jgi:predicted negative regulator of RcsB-dependent stress response